MHAGLAVSRLLNSFLLRRAARARRKRNRIQTNSIDLFIITFVSYMIITHPYTHAILDFKTVK